MSSIPVTIINNQDIEISAAAEAQGEDLWMRPSDLESSLGWQLKPAGLCRGELCIPIPPGRRASFVRADGAINLAALARHRGQAVVHDDRGTVWVLGRPEEDRASLTASAVAPDFTLPDLSGHVHSLSTYRGRKVLLASWASW